MMPHGLMQATAFLLRALSLLCCLVAIERPAKADPITAVTGAIGLGGNILGGILGKGAASKAGKIQEQANREAAARVQATTGEVNGNLIGAGQATAGQIRQAAGEAITRNDESTLNANKLLDPYRETGDLANSELSAGIGAGGDFNKTPSLADLQIDPGYAFRAQQATKALEGSAAAHGGALAGGGRDVLALNSNLASQEYQNAFERFRQTTGDRFARLNTLAGRGLDVAGAQGTNLIGGARYGGNLNYQSASDAGKMNFGATEEAGRNSVAATSEVNDLLTGGAAAKAAGVVGGTNALAGGIAGGANSVVGTLQLRNLLKNPNAGAYNPRTGVVKLPGYGYGRP